IELPPLLLPGKSRFSAHFPGFRPAPLELFDLLAHAHGAVPLSRNAVYFPTSVNLFSTYEWLTGRVGIGYRRSSPDAVTRQVYPHGGLRLDAIADRPRLPSGSGRDGPAPRARHQRPLQDHRADWPRRH